QANFQRFQDKWGPQRTAGYRLPPAPPESVAQPTAVVPAIAEPERPRVSLCLIVKNEEANLPACLGSAAELVDEIVVIDTASTDATKEIAGRSGARVQESPWVDSFAAARNESLRHASGYWIFLLAAAARHDE